VRLITPIKRRCANPPQGERPLSPDAALVEAMVGACVGAIHPQPSPPGVGLWEN